MESSLHYTPKELEVIRELLLGHTRRLGAFNLDMADGTFKNHIKDIYVKTNCHNMPALILLLLAIGFEVNPEHTKVFYMGKEI